jgi:uncharacterized protein YggU (UPF0235/DUF167 family)
MFLFDIKELPGKDGTLQIRIKPNSKQDRIIGTMANDLLKIELKAPATQ